MFCPKCHRAVQKPRGVSLCPHCDCTDYPVVQRPTRAKRKRTRTAARRKPKIRPPSHKKRAK